MHRERAFRRVGLSAVVLLFLISVTIILTSCGSGPQPGAVYGKADSEENLYVDLTALEAQEEALKEKELPEAEITDSGYTITEIDESDVYPLKKTDGYGNRLPAYLVDFAVRISNREGDLALVRPTVTVVAEDINGNKIASSTKTIRTYVLPGDEIAFASDMTVRGELPARIRFYAESEDPADFYPAEEELQMPLSDNYQAGDVHVRVLSEYEEEAPSAGRKNSEGLAKGYFRFGELPELSGEIRCDTGEEQEAFVTVLYLDGDQILGGETGRVRIPAGQSADYVLTAAGPVPEETDAFEVRAFSIADY